MRALASPASCKGASSAVEAALALAAGMRARRPRRGGGAGRRRRRGNGRGVRGDARRRVADGAASDPLGRRGGGALSRARGRDGGRRGGRGGRASRGWRRASATRCARRAAGSASSCSRLPAEAGGPILVGLGDSATVDGGAGLREVVGDALAGRELRALCDVRNPLLGERGAARAFGPQKGASPEQVEELEARLAGDGRASALRRPARSRGGGRARRRDRIARRRARLGLGARPRADRLPRPGHAAPTSSSPARGRSIARAAKGRQSARWCGSAARKACAARSSAGAWRRRCPGSRCTR